MKNIQYLYNVLYYIFYIIDVNLHYIFYRVNPARLIDFIPNIDYFVKKHYPGWERKKEYHKAMTNPETGLSSIIGGGIMVALLVIIIFGICNYLKILYLLNFNYSFSTFVFFNILSSIISYYVSFKNNLYLKYFKKFDALDKKAKRKLYLTGLGLIIVIVGLFWLSCYILLARHRQELLG